MVSTVSNQRVKKTRQCRHCRWTDKQYFKLHRLGGVEDRGQVALEKGNNCLWWHISISAVYNTHLKLLSTQNPLCGNLILYALSMRLLKPYIRRRIIVFLNMQPSWSIVNAPWAEMMCKIAFLEACRLGEEASWNRHVTSSTGRLFKRKISIYSAQESSTWNPILPGFLFWLLNWHGAHTYTGPNTDTQSLKQSYSITKVTPVMVKRVNYAISAGELKGV